MGTIAAQHIKLRLFAGTTKTYELTPQFFFDETPATSPSGSGYAGITNPGVQVG